MKSSFFGCLPAAPAMYMQSPREVTRMLNFLTEGNCGRKPSVSTKANTTHTHIHTYTHIRYAIHTYTHAHTFPLFVATKKTQSLRCLYRCRPCSIKSNTKGTQFFSSSMHYIHKPQTKVRNFLPCSDPFLHRHSIPYSRLLDIPAAVS